MDGICIGHPCCSRHNCQVPLDNGKDRFCPIHTSFNDICSIVDCDNKVVDGWLTCDKLEHQEIEHLHREKGQFCFQLHDQLQRAHAIHPTGSTSNSRLLSQVTTIDNDNKQFTIDLNGHVTADSPQEILQEPSTTNSRKLCAKFARSRTHNEQLVVAPCGMILGWDTMFGAEGIASVAVSHPFFVAVRRGLITRSPPGIYQAHLSH
jgi:hypothetical protein